MSNLISRQDAANELIAMREHIESRMSVVGTTAYEMAIEALREPEIVRCKDCKYWREHKYAKETKRYIPFCGFNAIYTKSDDFCSKGTRKTG